MFIDATQRFLEETTDTHFVKTKLYKKAYKVLSEKHIVVLTGHPGEGKTAMAANLAIEGGLKKENCVKLECARDWEDVNWSLRCFTTVIIDDIFGGLSLDQKRLENWKTVLSHIEQRAKDGELKVIITSRHYILQEANEDMEKVTMFNKTAEHTVHLNSRQMPATEFRQILKATLERKQINEHVDLDACVKNAIGVYNPKSGEREQCVAGFPECAALFATTYFISQGPAFFKRPERHFKEYIQQLYKSKDNDQFYKFIALVSVWANQNHTLKDTDLQNPMNVSPHIQKIADCFGIVINHSFLETLQHSLKAYTSYLLMYNHRTGEYTFTHNLINEMVGVVLGQHKPTECIRLCQRDFLMERLTLSEIEESEMKVTIPPRMYTDLCQKVIRLICPDDNSGIQDTFVLKHTCFVSRRFVNTFLQYIVKKNLALKLFNASCCPTLSAKIYVGTNKYLLDYIFEYNQFVLAEQIIKNVEDFLQSDTQISGNSIYIVMRKRPSLLKTLLESRRADPNSQCVSWYISYPLIEASKENLIDSVRQLLFYGADPNIKDVIGNTALHVAVLGGYDNFFETNQDDKKMTHYMNKDIGNAAECGYNDETGDSLRKKAHVKAKYYNGATSLHQVTFERGDKSKVDHCCVIAELLKSKADVNVKNIYARTPLHLAAYNGYRDAAILLLNNGADVNICGGTHNETALHTAAREGHCVVIAEILKRAADVNAKNSTGVPPLHLAAYKGYKDAVILLLNNGADVNICDGTHNETALHIAAREGHCVVIAEILKRAADVNAKNSTGFPPLHFAAHKGYKDAVILLLNNGADVNICDGTDNETALHHAAHEGHCAVIEEILKRAADVNAKNSKGIPPLHMAAYKGYKDAVILLLNNGADVNICDGTDNETALHYAACRGHFGVIDELLNRKADVNAKSSDGWSPLHQAAAEGHRDAVILLLNNGADINTCDSKYNETALHEAAFGGHCGVIAELLNRKADVNANASYGCSPLHLAAFKGHKDAVILLLNHGAAVNICGGNYNRSALHYAADGGHCGVIDELLKSEADVNAKDSNGSTPLHLAAFKGYIDAVKMLLKHGASVNSVNKDNHTALHCAADGGQCGVVEDILYSTPGFNAKDSNVNCEKHNAMAELINHNADVNVKDNVGDTPLHIARRLNDEEAVRILITHGATMHVNVSCQNI